MSGSTKRNPFFSSASEQRVWLWSPRWEMQRPKKILHLQTTVNRRIDKSQNKFSNVIQDAWGRTISDQNVGWNSDWTNLRKLSFRFKCGRPGFRTSGGKNCWTNWCQYARLLIKRTIILLLAICEILWKPNVSYEKGTAPPAYPMWRHSWLTPRLTITQNICPPLFESNMIHTFQTHLQQKPTVK